ncbi:MAG: sugar phosphate nucleotidyltransferase [Candidatus Njordarchaeia archaeon]
MKAIILAAGKGTRLFPLTKYVPKPLLVINNEKRIIDYQLEVFSSFDEITEVILVIGYKADMIEEYILEHRDIFKVRVRPVFNPFYDVSNNLISLWLGTFFTHDDDFIITNGDNIFKKHVIEKLLAQEEGIYLVIDHKDKYDEDDMKVIIKNGYIFYVSKEIELDKVSAESVGIAMIKGENARIKYINAIEKLIRNLENRNKFWLETFNYLAANDKKIKYVEISIDDWFEIDFHPDYEFAKKVILKNAEKWLET